MLAYLVIREGSKWTDVFRLVPGHTVTLGRAPTNQIVIKDERCSRCHAELFQSEGRWTLRDLDSRNGTIVGDGLVRGDHPLTPGDVIHIGRSQLAFVDDLSKAFPDSGAPARNAPPADESGTPLETHDDVSAIDGHEPTTITHRRGQTKFLEPREVEDNGVSKIGRAAAKLCRLAFELAKSPDAVGMAKLALAGLFEGTQVDAGALLLVRRGKDPRPSRSRSWRRARTPNCRTIAFHRFWPPRCCARVKPCSPATSWGIVRSAAETAKEKFTRPA